MGTKRRTRKRARGGMLRVKVPDNDLKESLALAIRDAGENLRQPGAVDCGNIFIFLQKLLDIKESRNFKTRIYERSGTINALKKDTSSYCFGINMAHFMYDTKMIQLFNQNPSEYFFELSKTLQNSQVLKDTRVEDAYYNKLVQVLGNLSTDPRVLAASPRTSRLNYNNNYSRRRSPRPYRPNSSYKPNKSPRSSRPRSPDPS